MFHRLLVAARRREGARTTSRRSIFIIHGAAPCPVEVKQRLMDWLGPIVWEYYAATEGAGTLVEPATRGCGEPGTVGKVDPPDHVRILDDDGADAARGEIGTVYLKAPGPTARVRVLQGAREDRTARTAATTSRSATSATSTPTATSSSPIAARTSSSAAA